MKNKIWVLIAIAGFVLALSACEHEVKNNYVPSKHLGIGEKCPKSTECGLKSYGTVDKQDIQRVGELDASKGFTDASIQNAATTIIETYGSFMGEQRDNVALNKIVQILKEGDTEYKNKELKVLFSDPNIASYLNGKAGPVLVYCPSPNAGHLGIDEDCIKNTGNCGGLQDYNTSTGDIETKFPVPIHRYGPLSNFGASPYTMLTDTVSHILATYALPSDGSVTLNSVTKAGKEGLTNDKRLDSVQIFNNPSWGEYGMFWEEKVLGFQANLEKDKDIYMYMYLDQAGKGILFGIPKIPVAQLQPAGNIRLAGGKKKTERFPAIAGGADKDPKVNTVAQNFKLIRQAIARNNRNVKVYSCT